MTLTCILIAITFSSKLRNVILQVIATESDKPILGKFCYKIAKYTN